MGCPHCERIGAFLDGELAASERAACEAHLLGCVECALELEHLKQMSLLLSVALEAERHTHHAGLTCARLRQRRLLWWSKGLALAASLLLLVSGFLLATTGGRTYSAADIAWEQAALMPQLAAVRIETIDPVAQKLLGLRP
ncbi:MAG: zf-HC2 domain-containing protein [Planctomycetota bacterium]